YVFYYAADHRDLLSFPTRRSSDLEPETQKHYLRLIHSEARRLTDLIDEFLDLQRIEQGSFQLALEPFELSELLREETELFSGQRDRKSTRLNSSHRTISYAVFCLK